MTSHRRPADTQHAEPGDTHTGSAWWFCVEAGELAANMLASWVKLAVTLSSFFSQFDFKPLLTFYTCCQSTITTDTEHIRTYNSLRSCVFISDILFSGMFITFRTY